MTGTDDYLSRYLLQKKTVEARIIEPIVGLMERDFGAETARDVSLEALRLSALDRDDPAVTPPSPRAGPEEGEASGAGAAGPEPGGASPGGRTPAPVMTILEQRRLEGRVVGFFHQAMTRARGLEKADALVGEAVAGAARQAGAEEAAKLGRPADLADFARILPRWAQGGALEMAVLAETPVRLDYDVTRCKYAETYRQMGLARLGFLLSCGRDGAYMEGYAPKVKMTRTTTIMEGGRICDFRYSLEEDD
ncbi:MAG: L-2-amino-thiazoline-4-carboxylic acid hydrolase [Deltaproteobacteria bacterium]|nr:L-2-amino-thiazoline-4-carboxylic acid hydrolase [Deltaproteobacteria bacterium]